MGESPKGNEGPSEKGVCVSVGGRAHTCARFQPQVSRGTAAGGALGVNVGHPLNSAFRLHRRRAAQTTVSKFEK